MHFDSKKYINKTERKEARTTPFYDLTVHAYDFPFWPYL